MGRLSAAISEEQLRPWTRATAIEDIDLYWMPVSGFPLKLDERRWLMDFLELWEERVMQPESLRVETFVHMRALSKEAADDFLRYTQRCITRMGLGRRPGAEVARFPTAEQIKEVAERGETIDLYAWIGDYHYWFVDKDAARQRELFLGYGGMMTLYLPPDPTLPKNSLPFTPKLREAFAVFQRFDVDRMIEGSNAAMDKFLPRSKELFGNGLEDRPEYPGIPFVLPMLNSADILDAKVEQRAEWFSFAPVYVRESPKDKGILLASSQDRREAIGEVLEELRRRGRQYPRVPVEYVPGTSR